MFSDNWRARLIAIYSLGIGLAGWWFLLGATEWDALRAHLSPLLAFTVLSVVLKHLGLHIARDVTHSLVGIVDLAAVFAFGPSIGAWVAALSGVAYLELRAVRYRLFSQHFLLEHPLFSSGLKAMMALVCGGFYTRLGGRISPTVVSWQMLAPLLATLGLWFALDHIAWGLLTFLRAGWAGLLDFYHTILAYSILVELLPLPLSIVIALSYSAMGEPAFVLFSLALVASGALLQKLTQAWSQLEQQLAELSVLNEFGHALVEAHMDLDQLYELLSSQCRRIVDVDVFILELVHPERKRVQAVVHIEEGERKPLREFPMTEMVKWMASRREPFLSNQVKKDGLPFDPVVIGDLPDALLMLPLLAGQELIGVLSLQSYRENAFDGRDLRVLSAITNQAAMAIANARAYQAEQRRARQLTAISQVSQSVAAILELDRLFADVVELIQETFHYDHVAIFTVDAETEQITFRASTNSTIQAHGLDASLGEGIIGWVAQFGDPILANDVSMEPRFCFTDVLEQTRAELAVPLKVEKRIVGVLDVQSNETGTFGSEDLFVLQTLADQVAIAVEDARQYAARQEEAWTSTALLQVAEAVSNLDNLDDILETAVRITPMLTGVDRCSILLWHEERQEFTVAKGYCAKQQSPLLFESMSFQRGDVAMLDALLAERGPVRLEDPSATELIPPDLVDEFGIGSLLALPLQAQTEMHGLMLVDHAGQPLYFSERKQALLSGIADRVGMAVANIRLHMAQREEAWVSTALLQVAQAFTLSTDLQENLARIARLTPLLVGVDRCLVLLWDSSEGAFVPCQSHGLSEEHLAAFHALRLHPSQSPWLDEMVREQRYAIVDDLDEDVVPTDPMRAFHFKSLLSVPMVTRGELLGAVLVAYTQGTRHFSARNISIVEGIAHQTAVAVENAHLYEATLEQERVAQELRVARDIQTSFLPRECPSLSGWEIAADWHAARGVGGDFYDFIHLDEEHLGLVIADVSDKGVPAALFMGLSRTLVRVGAAETRSPAKVLQRVNDLLLAATQSDMFLTAFYGILHWPTGRLTYASAGHNPPILWRGSTEGMATPLPAHANPSQAEQSLADQSMFQAYPNAHLLRARGIVLGIVSDISLQESQVSIEPGDVLVLYTDGVTEPINANEEEFGMERLVEVLANNHHKPCSEIVSCIRTAVSSFAGDQPEFDDYTLMSLKRPL
jgi:sigma-B regulation protein RsbU (phosphoserine phosphatase)